MGVEGARASRCGPARRGRAGGSAPSPPSTVVSSVAANLVRWRSRRTRGMSPSASGRVERAPGSPRDARDRGVSRSSSRAKSRREVSRWIAVPGAQPSSGSQVCGAMSARAPAPGEPGSAGSRGRPPTWCRARGSSWSTAVSAWSSIVASLATPLGRVGQPVVEAVVAQPRWRRPGHGPAGCRPPGRPAREGRRRRRRARRTPTRASPRDVTSNPPAFPQ